MPTPFHVFHAGLGALVSQTQCRRQCAGPDIKEMQSSVSRCRTTSVSGGLRSVSATRCAKPRCCVARPCHACKVPSDAASAGVAASGLPTRALCGRCVWVQGRQILWLAQAGTCRTTLQ